MTFLVASSKPGRLARSVKKYLGEGKVGSHSSIVVPPGNVVVAAATGGGVSQNTLLLPDGCNGVL